MSPSPNGKSILHYLYRGGVVPSDLRVLLAITALPGSADIGGSCSADSVRGANNRDLFGALDRNGLPGE